MQTVGDTRKRSELIDRHSQLSIRCQCRLLGIPRSNVYHECAGESAENLNFMEIIDKLHMEDPSAGTRRMQSYIHRKTGTRLSRKRIPRLMRLMGVEAIYPRKRTTIPEGPSGIHPYLLNGLNINRPDQVWCVDITYIPMRHGYT